MQTLFLGAWFLRYVVGNRIGSALAALDSLFSSVGYICSGEGNFLTYSATYSAATLLRNERVTFGFFPTFGGNYDN
ncbi:hypothetical protein [Pedobacter nutrimenti]|uniref:Uncharacterized protein n=1 Tax=Pedobacter nutrimenti TaxID=1241337 RepID=A0A318U961_9SPHI|nr:hypothetical protein [Pedobacter nutrimenti]PYF68416.1 hypothetical protein B0O44_11330 [Pedobacter nutrimenti]